MLDSTGGWLYPGAMNISDLDGTLLRKMYLDDRLSEAEIARRFGTYQVKINRMRARWGIPTITKSDRVSDALPELTPLQEEVLVGSLLGDGHMRAHVGAAFSEGHSLAQREYTDWKAEMLEPFTLRKYPTTKVDKKSGKVYRGWYFETRMCRQLRPWYDLFYPAPDRVRVFPENLPDLITPLALAIWYMDDGSVAGGKNARISFGLDGKSLKRALRAIRKLGLTPKVYGEPGNQAIWITGQTRLFLDLVESHIIQSMAYKLPVETIRQKTDRNAKRLTPKRALDLARGGMTDAEVAKVSGVGVSTVRRRLKAAGAPRRRPGPKTALCPETLLAARHGSLPQWSSLDDAGQDRLVLDVLSVLRKGSFPFPDLPDEHIKVGHWGRLQKGSADLTLATTGLKMCYPFFPNRYTACYRGRTSAFEAWYQDKALMSAIRWQLKVGDPVVPHRVLRAVAANCRTPTVFRPMVARHMYGRYCPSGGVVWDPCAGFGGRLLGALAFGVSYVATDVDFETLAGNQKLAEYLGLGDRVSLHQCPAEDFDPPDVDFVFTSPPYYHQEKYQGGDQSWKKYTTVAEWGEGFLRPLLARARQAVAARGGKVALNIADVKAGGVVPLESMALTMAQDVGLRLVATLKMPLASLHRQNPWEPIFVWSPS